MARLTRKNIKVFAGEATNNGVFGSLQANNPTTSNDVEQIQSLNAWGEGWNSATETSEALPPLEEFQGVQYVTTYQQAYLMQEGLPEWATTVTYYKGSLVKKVTSTGFQIYNSLTDNNAGNVLSDTSNWKLVMDSDDLYALDSTVVHNTGAENVAGVKTFSSSPIVPDGVNSTDAVNKGQLDSVETSLQTQINTKANTSDVVNLTGAQTITGEKNLTQPLKRGFGTIDSTTAPSSTVYESCMGVYDKRNNQIGYFGFENQSSNNLLGFFMQTQRIINGEMKFSTLGVSLDNTGKGWARAPASDVNGSILTTVSKSKSTNGYFKLGNGLIVQWGYATAASSSGNITIGLPTSFSNANYSIMYCCVNDGHDKMGTFKNRTVDSVKFYSNEWSGTGRGIMWLAVGY